MIKSYLTTTQNGWENWHKLNNMAKGSNAEIELRIQTVYEMIIKGATRPFILRYAAEKWDLKERQTDTYIGIANERIQEVFNEKDGQKLIDKHLEKLSDLYVKNYTIENFRECRNVLESERKLLGLDQPVKSENINKNYDMIMKPEDFIENVKKVEEEVAKKKMMQK